MASELKFMMARHLVNNVFPEGISEGVILGTARRLGIGRKIGRSIIFSEDDVKKLY